MVISLQEILNFTFTIEKPIDGEWGVMQDDGSWSGIVGMLARKEIDLGTVIKMIMDHLLNNLYVNRGTLTHLSDLKKLFVFSCYTFHSEFGKE